MKSLNILIIGIIFGCFALSSTVMAADLPKGLSGISIEGKHYLSWVSGEDSDGDNYDSWAVSRSYLTIKKKGITPFLDSRITLDAHQDGEGDMEVRLKYAYAYFKLNDFSFITKPNIELGLVHMPWLDFEQNMNYYRMIGKMFIERSGLFNSADFGFTFSGYFAGEMDDDYKKSVNKKYAGRYGSFAAGIYNGGGYHAEENNLNKVAEARITLRPMPDVIPGFQVSYFGLTGQGNQSVDVPDWQVNLVKLSYEHSMMTLTGQYAFGKGNQKGSWSDDNDFSGYSLFAEGKFGKNWRGILNYDYFDVNVDMDDDAYNRLIAGVGYDFGKKNILIFNYETKMPEDSDVDPSVEYKLTMQISY